MSNTALDDYEDEYRGHVQAAEEKLALAEANGASSDSGGAAVSAAERATEATPTKSAEGEASKPELASDRAATSSMEVSEWIPTLSEFVQMQVS